MSKRRHGSQPRFVALHGERHRRVLGVCAECGGKLKGRQQRWCGQACVDAYLIRSDSGFARRKVFERDNGVCARCGLHTLVVQVLVEHALEDLRDTDDYWQVFEGKRVHHVSWGKRLALEARVVARTLRRYRMERWWKRRSFYDVDHIIPVADGGGECGLDNLRTLCLACHRDVTTQWRRGRRRKKRNGSRRRKR